MLWVMNKTLEVWYSPLLILETCTNGCEVNTGSAKCWHCTRSPLFHWFDWSHWWRTHEQRYPVALIIMEPMETVCLLILLLLSSRNFNTWKWKCEALLRSKSNGMASDKMGPTNLFLILSHNPPYRLHVCLLNYLHTCVSLNVFSPTHASYARENSFNVMSSLERWSGFPLMGTWAATRESRLLP